MVKGDDIRLKFFLVFISVVGILIAGGYIVSPKKPFLSMMDLNIMPRM